MIALHGQYLYFTDRYYQVVERLDLETNSAEPFYNETSQYELAGLAFNSGQLYWTGCTEGPGTIGTIDEAGVEPINNYIHSESFGCSFGIAAGHGHLYWAETYGAGGITRSDLQGGHVEQEFIPGRHRPIGVALTPPPTFAGQASAGVPLGGTVGDTVMLEGGTTPTGTLTFSLYGPNDPTCSRSPVFSANLPAGGDSSYPAPSFTPAAPGAYRWTVSYSGDEANEPVAEGSAAPASG